VFTLVSVKYHRKQHTCMDDRPPLAELLYDLAEAHQIKAIAGDSEFDRGASDAFERAAGIIENAETVAPDDGMLKHTEVFSDNTSNGGEANE